MPGKRCRLSSFEQPNLLSLVLVTAVVGPMEAVLEMGAPPELIAGLRKQLTALCVGYLIQAAVCTDVAR
jgi:hypothetical protein